MQYAMPTPHFLFRFCIWRGSKNKSDVCHVLREVLFLLDITQNQFDVERGFQVSLDTCVVSLSVISLDSVTCINFSFNRMIFSIFQVSGDREDGLLLLSNILPCVVYCQKSYFLETVIVLQLHM